MNEAQMMLDTRQLWRSALIRLVVVLALFIALFWDSFASMVSIWSRSDTFAHGFLIAPISFWLIWRMWPQLAAISPRPEPWAIPLLALAGFGWLLAHFTDIVVGQQLMAVAMLIGLVLAVLGWPVVRRMAFPLGFLFLAVPMGEELIPPMMDFTADFTVMMLKLTGIPVYREGTFFEIPSGHWSVVEGCSGVRYLIAAITLGILYAYLTYRSLHRRLIFIAVSVVVPIIANGLRAYMIVMIAHLSDMRLALGVDHLIYGWVFFAIVITLLFWVGARWREDDEAPVSVGMVTASMPGAATKASVVGVVAVMVSAIWPAWAYVSEADPSATVVTLNAPRLKNWQPAPLFTDWKPRYIGQDGEAQWLFQRNGEPPVMLYVAYYATQRQDAELVNSQNVMVVQKHPVWRQTVRGETRIDAASRNVSAGTAQLDSYATGQKLLVYHWNWFDGVHTNRNLEVKLREAVARLMGLPRWGAAIVIATPYVDQPAEAEPRLRSFANDALPSLEALLREAGHG